MIQNLNGQMVLCYEIPLQKSNETLIDLLKLGARLKTTINTHSQRGIGKTSTLIKYAKEYNCIVVVGSRNQANLLKEKYKFDKIYGQDDMWLRKMQICVVDDDVNVNKLLKDMECNIITGFYNPIVNNGYESKSKSIQEQVIENLEEEIKSLSKVVANTRERGDFGTYKNLINSLKSVLELYNQETGQNNNIINTNVSLNLNDLIKIDSDGNMEVTKSSVNLLPNIKEITENVLEELKDQLSKRGLSRQLDINK